VGGSAKLPEQPSVLEPRSIQVQGIERSFAVARGAPPSAPLLLVLHGLGINGTVMAAWTGLARRGPAAGFATVFPDGLNEMWDDTGFGRSDGIDDAGFISALIESLTGDGTVRGDHVFLVGLSNGATFVEHLARHGVVKARGIVLVAGTSRVVSRTTAMRPVQECAVLCIAGTADPNVPYGGGRASGLPGLIARRRMRRSLLRADGRESVGAERICADWALANRCGQVSAIDALTANAADMPVERLTWSAPGRLPVVLYRILGGGHGWPGGPQYVPRFLVGRISKTFDATGVALDFARSLLDVP
jgi:polyhydroxybutyrate depolymerase